MEKVISIKNLSHKYNDGLVLDNVSLDIYRNDFVNIRGANGSGKSTLLRLTVGELKSYEGKINLLGEDSKSFKYYDKISYVPQIDRVGNIDFPISVEEYIILRMYYDFNIFNMPKKKHYKMLDDVISKFELGEFRKKNFSSLSGGQKQRVMLAKALINKPDILILDEPTVGVDKKNKKRFFKLLNELHEKTDITIILITHEDKLLDKKIRVIRIKEGKVLDV